MLHVYMQYNATGPEYDIAARSKLHIVSNQDLTELQLHKMSDLD